MVCTLPLELGITQAIHPWGVGALGAACVSLRVNLEPFTPKVYFFRHLAVQRVALGGSELRI